jgi:hypothetical protein
VLLDGVAIHPTYVEETTTWYLNTTNLGTTTRLLFPLVDEGASASDPVQVLFEGYESELSQADPNRPHLRGLIPGVIRSALWEGGISDKTRAVFAEQGVQIAPDARIVSAIPRSWDRFAAYGWTAGFFVLGLFVAEQHRLRDAQQKAHAPGSAAA